MLGPTRMISQAQGGILGTLSVPYSMSARRLTFPASLSCPRSLTSLEVP